jgi:STE24 endopeptidase
MDAFCFFIAVLIVARAAVSIILDALNRDYATRHADAVPKGMDGFVDLETYARSIRYTVATSRFSSIEVLYDSVVLAFFLFSGILPWIFRNLEVAWGYNVFAQSAILLVIGLLIDLPEWLSDWWHTFRVEAQFGFNKTTPRLWLIDKLKGIAVSSALMFPLMCLLLVIVRLPYWWFWGFVCVFVFQLLLMVIYPMWIMPLFNKFTPLQEGELKDRLMSLAERTGFHAKTILVMDGSKRSGHSNAFFSGIGKSRRVVLFDTLIAQLEPEELEAVLAHEIGHYKLGHIPKMLAVAAVLTLGAFALIGWLAGSAWFVTSFGFSYDPQHLAPVFLLFSLLAGLATFWFTPLGAMFSRKHEYQADAFALHTMQNDPEPLIRALRKLHTKNLGNLVPHPIYSAFHYSHPTLLEREAALRGGEKKNP